MDHRQRIGNRLTLLLGAAVFLASLPLDVQPPTQTFPTVSIAAAHAKDGKSGGSDDSGSDDSGGSGSSGSGGSGSSGHGGGDDGPGDDHSGSGSSGGSENSGSSSENSGKRGGERSVGDFLGLLKKKGEIAKVSRTGNSIVVRYTDGWREQVVNGSYQLIDRRNRVVVSRPASATDLRRLQAAAR